MGYSQLFELYKLIDLTSFQQNLDNLWVFAFVEAVILPPTHNVNIGYEVLCFIGLNVIRIDNIINKILYTCSCPVLLSQLFSKCLWEQGHAISFLKFCLIFFFCFNNIYSTLYTGSKEAWRVVDWVFLLIPKGMLSGNLTFELLK